MLKIIMHKNFCSKSYYFTCFLRKFLRVLQTKKKSFFFELQLFTYSLMRKLKLLNTALRSYNIVIVDSQSIDIQIKVISLKGVFLFLVFPHKSISTSQTFVNSIVWIFDLVVEK